MLNAGNRYLDIIILHNKSLKTDKIKENVRMTLSKSHLESKSIL